MDPNHWSNYNQAYGRISHSGGMPAAHSTINRYELPLLDQGLGSGLGALSPSLSPHTSLASARGLAGMPPVNYGHPLHNSVSQLFDTMNLQSPFSSQSPYKTVPVGSPSFAFESSPRSSTEQSSSYSSGRYVSASHGGVPAHSKSIFNQDFHSGKDLSSALSPSPLSPQPHPVSVTEPSAKGWSLSNFVPPPSNPFGNLANELSSNFTPSSPVSAQHIPPPAHSANTRMSASQRSPFQPDPIYGTQSQASKSIPSPQLPSSYSRMSSQSIKPAHSPQLHSPYNMSTISHGQDQPPTPLSQPSTPRPQSYSSSPQDMETLPSSQQPTSPLYDPYNSISTKGYTGTSNAPAYSSVTHMTSDMGYDPVSPTTPLSDHQQGDTFSTVSLQDLASIGSSQDRMQNLRENLKARDSVLLQETSHIMIHSTTSKASVQPLSDLQQAVQNISARPPTIQTSHSLHNGQLSQSVQSPMQQSPISVGSPPAPMSLGSPQTPMPSSTVVQAPPPVQAIADSTTKPKRGRGRKKKDIFQEKAIDLGQDSFFHDKPLNMTQNQSGGFPDMSQVMNQSCHDTIPPQPLTEDALSPTFKEQVDDAPIQGASVSPVLEPPLSVGQYNDQPCQESQDCSPASIQPFSVPESVESPQPCSENIANMRPPSVSDSIDSPQGVLSEDMSADPTPLSNPVERPVFSDSLTPPPAVSRNMSNIQPYGVGQLPNQGFVNQMSASLENTDRLHVHESDTSAEIDSPAYMNFSHDLPKDDLSHTSNNFDELSVDKTSAPGFEELVEKSETKLDVSLSAENLRASSAEVSPPERKLKRSRTKAEQKQMPVAVIAVTSKVEYDDEFLHLQQSPPLDLLSPGKVKQGKLSTFGSFQDSYLNFLQGKKSETLSSLSYANVIRRPHASKCTSEPRKYLQQQTGFQVEYSGFAEDKNVMDMAALNNFENQDAFGEQGRHASHSSMTFSDDDDNNENITNVVQNVLTNLIDEQDNRDKMMYRRFSGDLLRRSISGDSSKSQRSRGRSGRGGGRGPRGKRARGRSQSFSEREEYLERHLSEGQDKDSSGNEFAKEPVAMPVRMTSLRRVKGKKMKHRRKRKKELGSGSGSTSGSEESGSFVGSSNESAESILGYDSDKDPAWTPFALQEKKQQSTFEEVEFDDKPRRGRGRGRSRGRGRGGRGRGRGRGKDGKPDYDAFRIPELVSPTTVATSGAAVAAGAKFKDGDFIIEKKDLTNYEKYPVWKIETGRLQKYELFNDDGTIRHRAVPTYRTWTPTWQQQFTTIKVTQISSSFNTEVVEVVEECRPKTPSNDSKDTGKDKGESADDSEQDGSSPPVKVKKLASESESEEDDDEEEEEEEDDKRDSDTSESEDSDSDSDSGTVHNFEPGKFIIEKKDLTNYESYPIWKIENGKMLHKYELIVEEGKIQHRAVPTYSSWMPTLKQQFKPIRAKLISQGFNKEIVEVEEQFRPKPPNDGSLERQYEDDPLVEMFNVYMQVFLRQALEPGFLGTVMGKRESFHLIPLQKIDKLIKKKVEEIELKVEWRSKFKECLKQKPFLRELDRPNLKQSCQACENASQPAIKSIHLYGQPYDHLNLGEAVSETTDSSNVAQEFMIGKTAGQYVGTYHSLYHFKYHLYERCLAKVNIIIKESERNLDNAEVVDQCLQNRAWVLKLFEDLKTLLEKR